MKKILIPSLTALAICPTVCMVGCTSKVVYNTKQMGGFDKFKPVGKYATPLASQSISAEQAWEQYFDCGNTGNMLANDWIYSHLYLHKDDDINFTIESKITNFNKKTHKISGSIRLVGGNSSSNIDATITIKKLYLSVSEIDLMNETYIYFGSDWLLDDSNEHWNEKDWSITISLVNSGTSTINAEKKWTEWLGGEDSKETVVISTSFLPYYLKNCKLA